MSKRNRRENALKIAENNVKMTKNNLWDWTFFIGIAFALFLPLLNFPPLFYADFGRAVVFRILAAILTFLFIFRIVFDKKYNPNAQTTSTPTKKNNLLLKLKDYLLSPPTYLIGLFLIFVIATIFSANFSNSLFNTPQRAGGSLNYFLYIIFAALSFLMIQDEKKWKKLWIIALSVGILTAFIAIEQKYQVSPLGLIESATVQTPSTMGGPIFFGNYLILLTFLPLIFLFIEKKWKVKIIYLSIFLLFIFVLIFCAEKRGPIAGLIAGILFFVLFYPKKLLRLKISILLVCILGIIGLQFLRINPEISLFQENKTINSLLNKISVMNPLSLKSLGVRSSGWILAVEGIKDKPLFGWGPENYSIAFDKYYDPKLQGLKMDPTPWGTHSSWWDKPHNFLLDYAVSTGIIGLLMFLLLVGTIFWKLFLLRRIQINTGAMEHDSPQINMDKKNADLHRYQMWAHGAQTTFVAYFVALFFSFDTVPTFIVFFLLIAFSLFLIKKTLIYADSGSTDLRGYTKNNLHKYRWPIVVVLGIILLWFCWNWNIKPLLINEKINIALAQDEAGNYKAATTLMDKISKQHSFLDNYLRLKYLYALANRIADFREKAPDKKALLEKALETAEENAKSRQTYVRDWIYLGDFLNMAMESNFWPEKKNEFMEKANTAFKKAFEISPKRQEIYLEWIKTDIIANKYNDAEKRSQACIDLNPETKECYWMMGLSQIFLGKNSEAEKNIEIAKKSGVGNGKEDLLQLAKAYGDTKNYLPLVKIYQSIITIEPENPQHYASLAFVFKALGEYKVAKEQALEILKLAPEAKADVDKFIESLPKNTN